MPQILELSDNNIESAIIKMLQVRVNILETKRESQQRNRKYQEMTTIITKINSLGQLSGIVEMTKKRVNLKANRNY